jgi:hypothetical protein
MEDRWRRNIVAADFGEIRGLDGVAGGKAISTTKARVLIPPSTKALRIKAHNAASSATVAQLFMFPHLSVLKTADDGATFTDYSSEAQDEDATTDITLSSLDTAANDNFLYVGAHRKFAGLTADIDAGNDTASVMTVKYYAGNQGWLDISDTDGTDVAGDTLKQDGDITWTAPANWKKTIVNGLDLYWVRIEVSVALDSSVTLNSLWPIMVGSAFQLAIGEAPLEVSITTGVQGWRCIEAITDTGTCDLIVNGASMKDGEF